MNTPSLSLRQILADVLSEVLGYGTVDILKKLDFANFPAILNGLYTEVRGVQDVEIATNDQISIEESRLIRIFARKFQGKRCQLAPIRGGLSGSRVLRMRLTDVHGSPIHNCVAKLGTIPIVHDESQRFDSYVSRLKPEATPRKILLIEHGAKASAGIFYSLAEGYEFTFFEKVGDAAVVAAVAATRTLIAPWCRGVVERGMDIGTVRQSVIDDATALRLIKTYNLTWAVAFEKRNAQTKWCCVHGDLHGGNVLLDAAGHSIVIDYGDVGDGPVSIDPLTLEFSLLFHPDSPWRGKRWPTRDQARVWFDIEKYLPGCPQPELVKALRNWSTADAAGMREIVASAYTYFLRQLKHDGTDKELAVALLEGAQALYKLT